MDRGASVGRGEGRGQGEGHGGWGGEENVFVGASFAIISIILLCVCGLPMLLAGIILLALGILVDVGVILTTLATILIGLALVLIILLCSGTLTQNNRVRDLRSAVGTSTSANRSMQYPTPRPYIPQPPPYTVDSPPPYSQSQQPQGSFSNKNPSRQTVPDHSGSYPSAPPPTIHPAPGETY